MMICTFVECTPVPALLSTASLPVAHRSKQHVRGSIMQLLDRLQEDKARVAALQLAVRGRAALLVRDDVIPAWHGDANRVGITWWQADTKRQRACMHNMPEFDGFLSRATDKAGSDVSSIVRVNKDYD